MHLASRRTAASGAPRFKGVGKKHRKIKRTQRIVPHTLPGGSAGAVRCGALLPESRVPPVANGGPARPALFGARWCCGIGRCGGGRAPPAELAPTRPCWPLRIGVDGSGVVACMPCRKQAPVTLRPPTPCPKLPPTAPPRGSAADRALLALARCGEPLMPARPLPVAAGELERRAAAQRAPLREDEERRA